MRGAPRSELKIESSTTADEKKKSTGGAKGMAIFLSVSLFKSITHTCTLARAHVQSECVIHANVLTCSLAHAHKRTGVCPFALLLFFSPACWRYEQLFGVEQNILIESVTHWKREKYIFSDPNVRARKGKEKEF